MPQAEVKLPSFTLNSHKTELSQIIAHIQMTRTGAYLGVRICIQLGATSIRF